MTIGGGWNTEMGPSAKVPFQGPGAGVVPWLVRMENAVYTQDGWPIKMPGGTRVNATATGATDHVMGLFDFWRSANGLFPTQRKVVYSGSAIYVEVNGTLTSIQTGLETLKMPAFETMNDNLVMATDSDTDVPLTYDQTTVSNLGGSPPNFSFHVQHKDRMWAAGAANLRSRLYYSISGSAADWTGAGSGSIDVAPDDGDVITGLRSLYNNELVIFKGPNRGSLFRLSGSAPTGTDAFTLKPIVRGVGCTSHQAAILWGGDLLFPDHNGLHSLAATEKFGDYSPSFLSAPIRSYWLGQLNHNRFGFMSGVPVVVGGYVLWTLTRSNAITNNAGLGLDFRFNPPRFFLWPAALLASLAIVADTNHLMIPWGGNYTGRMLRLNQETRLWDTAAYTYTATMPFLAFADAFYDKQASKGHVELVPTNDANLTVAYTRDTNTQQSVAVNMATSVPTLATSSNQFTLGTSRLGGNLNAGLHAFFDMAGSFKDIQIEFSQGGASVHAEPRGFSLELETAGIGTAAVPG